MAISVGIFFSILGVVIYLRLRDAELNGDTPEVCRLYLQQNALIHSHFGQLETDHFESADSMALWDDAHPGGTQGIYVFKVVGTKAKGLVEMIWVREPGTNGVLIVPGLKITEEHSFTPKAPARAERAPAALGYPQGPVG